MDEKDWNKASTGQRIVDYLALTRQTHMEAAITLGVAVSTVSRWANGKNVPDLRTRRTIAAAMAKFGGEGL